MDKCEIDFYHTSSCTMVTARVEPGWKWSKYVKPIVGTDLGYEYTVKAGDVYDIPPGHDGWVAGDEICTMIDYMGGAKMESDWKEK
ncbi:hypothetical protein HDU91_002142 [Kappamyces sp. JEL0680]|nr:hypothetical protein HDU91_002142 [Kappamyces sp. JEL0680]